MRMNNNLNHLPGGARQVWIGALVFLLPALSLITLFGVSLVSFLLLLSALFMFAACRAALARHWHETRLVVSAFLFNFGYALLGYLVRPETTANNLEKPARMLFALSALALVLAVHPPRRALWWGVIAGAVGALVLVAYQRLGLGLGRPGGLINPITFGDIALCLALLAMVAASDFRGRGHLFWPVLGALAGLAAALLTGSRGGLLALPVAAFILARHRHLVPGGRVRALLVAGLALCVAALFVPAVGMQGRMAEGVSDVQAWAGGGSKDSSMGIRLELWKGGAMLAREHPLFGVGPNNLHAHLGQYVGQGRLDAVVLPLPHLHNDVLQVLATGGVVGLAAWLGLLAAPLLFFLRALHGSDNARRSAPAFAGLLVVLCYFCFGLTEVIFWSVKGSLFYALMVFLLMGFCLNEKEQIGK
jgi:O-antigen ligase